MINKKIIAASVLATIASMSFANDLGYVTSKDGKPVMSDFGLCWTSSATKVPMKECGDVVKKEEKVVETKPKAQPYQPIVKVEQPIVKVEAPQNIQVVFASSVLFRFDSDVLSVEGKQALYQDIVKQNPQKINIHGHTDRIGPAKYNMNLSLRRANAVRAYLVQKGIDPNAISTQGHGETKLLCQESTRACNQLNRRVEIIGEK